jgi:hypothetical protein
MKANQFLPDIRGQLDINLAVAAVLGLVLVSAFLVIGTVYRCCNLDAISRCYGDNANFHKINTYKKINNLVLCCRTKCLFFYIGV